MKTLSAEQEAAVESDAHVTCVLAGPGSGKTTVLIERICRRVSAGIVDPRKIVVLSFTNAAAHEFVARLAARGIPRLGYAGTRHGWCFRLIQQHGARIGYKAGAVSMITEEQARERVEAVAARLYPKKGGGSTISKKALYAKESDNQVALVWVTYHRELKLDNAVDYDRVLIEGATLLMLRDVRDVLNIAELYADEKQDDSAQDWDVDNLILADRKFYIGDCDQSIFGFRMANPKMLATCPGAQFYTLENNYRSTQAITDAANALIAHNARPFEKYTRPMRGGGNVYTLHNGTEREELATIASLFRSENTTPFGEMAVLTRNNDLADKVREELRRWNMPLAEPEQIPLPADWSLCLATIALMHNPNNNIAAERWLRESGAKPGDVARELAEANVAGRGLLEGWKGTDARPFKEPIPIGGVIGALVMMRISRDSVRLVNERIAVLPQNSPTTGDLIHDLWDHQSWSKPAAGERTGITVSTIHGFKGREASLVIIAGMEEGILPGRGDIEEERRLAYVAITRAKDKLFLSSVATRWRKWGVAEQMEPSRFIEEAGV